MGRGYSVEQWAEWIEEQQASGLSIAAFCEWIGVSQNAFYVRRRQLLERGLDRWQQSTCSREATAEPKDVVPTSSQNAQSAAGFVSLRLVAGDATGDGAVPHSRPVLEVELPGGSVVRVNDPQIAGDIVSVILEHGAPR